MILPPQQPPIPFANPMIFPPGRLEKEAFQRKLEAERTLQMRRESWKKTQGDDMSETAKESAAARGSNATTIQDWTPIEYPPIETDDWTSADLLNELGDAAL
jgi:hypothetical protein